MAGQIPQAAQASPAPAGSVSKFGAKPEVRKVSEKGDENFSKHLKDIDTTADAVPQKLPQEDSPVSILNKDHVVASELENEEGKDADSKTTQRQSKDHDLNFLVGAALQTERAKEESKGISSADGGGKQARQIKDLKQQVALKQVVEGKEVIAEAQASQKGLKELTEKSVQNVVRTKLPDGGNFQNATGLEKTGPTLIGEFAEKRSKKDNQNAVMQTANHKRVNADAEINKATVVKVSEKTYFPSDTEKHVWQQVGQSIAQNLTGAVKSESEIQTSQTLQSDTTSSSVSKVVKHLQIQLKPENLGKVDVKLTITNGMLEVTLSASDGHLARRLQEHAGHLSKQLKSAGFSFENLTVKVLEGDLLRTPRFLFTPDINDPDQYSANQDGQQYSQPNKGFFEQARDQRSDHNQERQLTNEHPPEEFASIDESIDVRGSIRL